MKKISLPTIIKLIHIFVRNDTWKDLLKSAKVSPSTAMRFIKFAKEAGFLEVRREIVDDKLKLKFVIIEGKYKINVDGMEAMLEISKKGNKIVTTVTVESLYK
ncbi:MAG: hypothetical protein QXW35_01650 [Candidatus Aenigmatarchaeota archaeon]